jgi:hypothetical protein
MTGMRAQGRPLLSSATGRAREGRHTAISALPTRLRATHAAKIGHARDHAHAYDANSRVRAAPVAICPGATGGVLSVEQDWTEGGRNRFRPVAARPREDAAIDRALVGVGCRAAA